MLDEQDGQGQVSARPVEVPGGLFFTEASKVSHHEPVESQVGWCGISGPGISAACWPNVAGPTIPWPRRTNQPLGPPPPLTVMRKRWVCPEVLREVGDGVEDDVGDGVEEAEAEASGGKGAGEAGHGRAGQPVERLLVEAGDELVDGFWQIRLVERVLGAAAAAVHARDQAPPKGGSAGGRSGSRRRAVAAGR